MAQGKVNLFGLGTGGVNVVKSPIHLDDQELTKAQNAVPDTAAGLGSIRKRNGLTPLNSSAMSGAIQGVAGFPLPDPANITRTLYVALCGAVGANLWMISTDGTNWTNTDDLLVAQTQTQYVANGTIFSRATRILAFDRKIFYAGDDYTQYATASHEPPPLLYWDGEENPTVVQIPYPPALGASSNVYTIQDMVMHKGEIYVSTYEDGSSGGEGGRVFRFDPVTGQLTQIGNAWGGHTGAVDDSFPVALCSYQGRLWAGTNSLTGGGAGKLYSIATEDETATWSAEKTDLAAYVTSIQVFRGDLYIGCIGEGGNAALLIKRTSGGTYSTALTGAGTDGGNHFTCLGTYNSEFYVGYYDNGGATHIMTIHKQDTAGAWTTDRNVYSSDYGGTGDAFKFGQAATLNGKFYVVIATPADTDGIGDTEIKGAILEKSGSTWTKVASGLNTRGFVAVLEELNEN